MIINNKHTHSLLIALMLISLTFQVSAQEQPPTELVGKELRQWLKANWYDDYHWNSSITSDRFNNPVYTDPYRDSRKEMYNYIDNKNNTVVGVYSGYTVEWTYGGIGSNPYPINAEHTVPQSFFRPSGEENSSEPMRSDIHHLFPTYGVWNSTRSNYPFGEVEDQRATKWMFKDKSTTVVPDENEIDLYSEFTDSPKNIFEPREDHKGDLARAVLYFYCMYEDNELVFRPLENVASISTLLAWHKMDPVDEKEVDRNLSIAAYQGNKNPFISNPDLVESAWGTVLATQAESSITLYPNPTSGLVNIHAVGINRTVQLINLQGQTILNQPITSQDFSLDISQQIDGIYTLIITGENEVLVQRIIKN